MELTKEDILSHFVGSFFDELVKWGVRDIVVCPGSRSTPLAMVAYELHRRSPESLNIYVDVDERGAAFFALGAAKATGAPAAVICTSGSAVANFYPAVLEAESSRVPLIVLTADRPPQLQGVGAPQTCDQQHIFGTHVRTFRQMPLPSASSDALFFARQAARQACISATHLCKNTLSDNSQDDRDCTEEMRIAGACFGGPVHINFPFEKPLTPNLKAEHMFFNVRTVDTRDVISNPPQIIRAAEVLTTENLDQVASLFDFGAVLVFAGEGTCETVSDAKLVLEWARTFNVPVLADPLSGLRGFESKNVICNYESILDSQLNSSSGKKDLELNADVILRFGRWPICAVTTTWARERLVDSRSTYQIVVDPFETRDTNTSTHTFIRMRPTQFARCMLQHKKAFKNMLSERAQQPYPVQQPYLEEDWLATSEAVDLVRECIGNFNEEIGRKFGFVEPFTTETKFVKRALELAPANSCVFAANSMSVRAVDSMLQNSCKQLVVLANRGLNGIDGTISSAIGASRHFSRTTLIIGDLAMLHDINALALQREVRKSSRGLTIVLLNNNGGEIFKKLPQKSSDSYFERLFTAPQDVNFKNAAAAFNVPYKRVQTLPEFDAAYEQTFEQTGITLVEVKAAGSE